MDEEKFTHEEYVEWREARGLYTPKKCDKCGSSYHYICIRCNPDFFKPKEKIK